MSGHRSWQIYSIKIGSHTIPYGAVGDPKNPLALYAHGLGEGHRSGKDPATSLAEDGELFVVTPPNPGAVGTPGPNIRSERGWGPYAYLTHHFIGALRSGHRIDDRPIHFIGRSTGGGIVTQLAYDYPLDVASVTLLNAVGGFEYNLRNLSPPMVAKEFLRHLKEITPHANKDVASNAAHSHGKILHTAKTILDFPLLNECSAMRRNGIAVTVFGSLDDGLIPQIGFESQGRLTGQPVVMIEWGGHSWFYQPELRPFFVETIAGRVHAAEKSPRVQSLIGPDANAWKGPVTPTLFVPGSHGNGKTGGNLYVGRNVADELVEAST